MLYPLPVFGAEAQVKIPTVSCVDKTPCQELGLFVKNDREEEILE
jgi:hypothetical protein